MTDAAARAGSAGPRDPVPTARWTPRVREQAVLGAVALVVGLVVTWPFADRGWLQLLDWTPGPLRPRGLGSAATLPAGPVFSALTWAVRSVSGASVGWVPIAVALVIAGIGAGNLVPVGLPARVVAVVAFAWNPFVYDRVYAGQVALLLGYAVLPWLAAAAWRPVRPGGGARGAARAGIVAGLLWALAAACSLHLAWIGGLVVLAGVIVGWDRAGARATLRRVGTSVGVVGVLTAVWVLPRLAGLRAGGSEVVLATFGTRADPTIGRSLGLLVQLGFWRAAPMSPRDDLGSLFVPVAIGIVALAIGGLLSTRRTPAGRIALAAAISGGVGWFLAHGAAGPTGALYRALWRWLPAFAVMREAQKFAMLVSLAAAVGLACAADSLGEVFGRRRSVDVVLAAGVMVLAVALAPTLAGGLWGRVEPTRYPAAWSDAAARFRRADGTGVALPWELYLALPSNGDRVVENPLPGWFGERLLVSRDAGAPGIPGDRGQRRRVGAAVADALAAEAGDRPMRLGRDLAGLGVGWVVTVDAVEGGVPDLARDPGLRRVGGGEGLWLWRVRHAPS